MILVSLTLVGAIWLFYANHQDKDSQTKVNPIIASTIYLSASMSMIFKKNRCASDPCNRDEKS